MAKPFKGGRGRKAPYQSTHIRCPEPIKDRVVKLIDDFKTGQLHLDDVERVYEIRSLEAELESLKSLYAYCEGKLLKSVNAIPLEQAKKEASKILRSKKSARQSINALLAAIYGVDANL